MALAHLGHFRGPGVKPELRTDKADQPAVLLGQFGRIHVDGAAAQFGVADHELAAVLFQQQAGAFALEQQDGGQQVRRDVIQRALDHARRKLRPRGRPRQQGGREAVFFQGQARRQGLRGRRDAVQAGDFHQAIEQRVVVRGAGVRAPFPGSQIR